MDIWEKLYNAAKKEYHPEQVSPFIDAHHVVCAIEAEDGQIFTGFCIEGASGVISLCAERVAGLNMYIQSGQTVAKRMIAFRKEPPKGNGGMPCGACREFFLQLSSKNKDMEILTDYDSRKTVTLEELMPGWWGWKRYNNHGENNA
ncbi:MAG: cytidine deaminase [Clostridia bacterium]|nr:cytidine deaminase [Clostridia bacterium]